MSNRQEGTEKEAVVEPWEYDLSKTFGGQMSCVFTSLEGEEIRGRTANEDDWIEDKNKGPVCGDCRQDLEPVDKRFGGRHWLWKLACPVCERALFVKASPEVADQTVDGIQDEYVTSDVMSEASLEWSLERVINR